MADGMSFLIQVDSETPGLSDLLSGLDKTQGAAAKLTVSLKGLDAGTKKTGEGAKETEGIFDRLVKKGLDPFIERAERIAEFEFIREGAEALLDFPIEMGRKLLELGEDAITTAADAERMERAFENALGKDLGKETVEYFDDIADKTEFTHHQIRDIGLELSKSGFKGEGLKNAVAAIADLGSMTSNPVQGAELALSALQRIQASGRLEARALVPFGIQKGEFEKELSEETGLGLKAMRKEMEAGKIPTETVLNSLFRTITNKTGEDLGGVGTAMTDTLESRLTHLKEKPELFFEGLTETKGFTAFSDFVAQLGEGLDPKSATGALLSGALQTAMDEFGETLAGVDLDAVFTEAAGVIKELPDDLHQAGVFIRDDIVPAAKDAWEIFKDIVDFIKTTKEGLGIGAHAVSTFLGGGETLGASQSRGDKAIDIMRQNGGLFSETNAVGKYLAQIPGVGFLEDRILNPEFWKLRFSDATKVGNNDVQGYITGVQSKTGDAAAAMTTLADATTDAMKDAHQQHSPSELFAQIAELDAAGYIQGLERSGDDVRQAVEDLAPPEAAAAAGGGGAGFAIGEININVNVDGGGKDAYETGRLAARGAEDEMELVFLRILEKVNKRQGSS